MNDELKLAVQIMSGLLASGHYTEMTDYNDGENPEPKLRMWDAGKGEKPRFHTHAVDDALYLLGQIEKEITEWQSTTDLQDAKKTP